MAYGNMEPNGAAVGVAKQAARWQRDRVLALVDKRGAKHLTVREIASELKWPLDSAQHWVDELRDSGDLEVCELGEGGGDYRLKRSGAA